MISLEALTRPITVAEAKTSIYNVLGVVGVSTTSWKPGAVVRTMITACAIVIAALSVLISLVARSGFLDLSAGDWLTLVAKYVYNVDRIEATFATGSITLNNAGGGVFVIDAEDLIFTNPTTGKAYRNTAAFTLGALEVGKVVAIRAVEEGAASSTAAGTITALETPLPAVSCSNAAALVGRDAETDPALRLRCREKLGALSPNGPADAYGHFARTAVMPDGSSAGVTRLRVVKDGYGNVIVYVGTASGGITGDADDASTPLGAVHDSIQRNAVPLAVTETTATAVEVAIPVTYTAWMYNDSGLTVAQIKALIEASLLELVSNEPIGGNEVSPDPGKVFHTSLSTAIGSTRPTPTSLPLPIFKVAVTTPAGDTTLSLAQAPTLGAVTGTIVQIPRPTL